MSNYFILDIETAPLQLEVYEQLNEEERKSHLNPIDSKIVAIGLRSKNANTILMDDNEKRLLEHFWKKWNELRMGGTPIVGFNITNFDLPFIVTRSFINNIKITPFTLKFVVDLREKVNAYRYGPSRGTLKDFGKALGIPEIGMDGSHIAMLWKNKEFEKIKSYLENDLLITDKMYQRMEETNILQINKW